MILAYDGTTIRIDAADSSVLSWLQEFLTPAFSAVKGPVGDYSVELITDDRLYAAILANGQRVSWRLGTFALERSTVRLPLWASTANEQILYDPTAKVFYSVNADGTRVRVIAATHHLPARFATMRVVREFAMNAAKAARSLLIHGAAFATATGVVVLAGVKAAGKTSLLIHALRSAGARFVSNDRVVVRVDGDSLIVRGMPTVVTIRPQALALFPDLRTGVLRSRYDHRLGSDEVAPPDTRRLLPRLDQPVDLSPPQFCRLLGAEMCGVDSLCAIVFPTLTTAHDGISVHRLPAESAAERLSAALFAMESSEVFPASTSCRLDPATFQALSSDLLSRVPALECQLGPQAYQSGGALMDLIDHQLVGA